MWCWRQLKILLHSCSMFHTQQIKLLFYRNIECFTPLFVSHAMNVHKTQTFCSNILTVFDLACLTHTYVHFKILPDRLHVGLILRSIVVATASQSTFKGTVRVHCTYCMHSSSYHNSGRVTLIVLSEVLQRWYCTCII